jgi:uncharacterized coiled-coil protein SlyX
MKTTRRHRLISLTPAAKLPEFRAVIRRLAHCCLLFSTTLALPFAARAQYNTAYGQFALSNVTTGDFDSAFGYGALANVTSGQDNSGFGYRAVGFDNDGSGNTGCGSNALYWNISGNNNTAVGRFAHYNVRASENTAVGSEALLGSTDSIGRPTSTGGYNTAIGSQSLHSNAGGGHNVAAGWQALYSNQSGEQNTATGSEALASNTAGTGNTAEGFNALAGNTMGSDNIAIGISAGFNLTTGNGNIDIGNQGVAGESGKIRIGTKGSQTATYIAGISGKTVASASAVAVFVDNTGKLGTVKSSARFKEEINPMDKASEALLKLEPVSFRYKKELDPDGVRQFGLIAEQVEKIDPDLVVRDEDGTVSTVRYEAVNAMLLNEFLKEHRIVQSLQHTAAQQETTIDALKSTIARQQAQIEKLTIGLQKVTNQVEIQQPVLHVAANDENVPLQRTPMSN